MTMRTVAVHQNGGTRLEEAPLARVTLQTIADELGVSRMTVSNAFSRPDQLSSSMRERVLDAAARLGYAGPDPAARALARGRTGVIGMVLTDDPGDAFRDDVAVGFVRSTAESLAASGYSLALLHRGTDDIVPARDVAMDGAIVYACTPRGDAMRELRRRRLPIVRVEGDDVDDVDGILDVSIDDRSGAAAAARHLVELGHRDVAVVTTGIDAAGDELEADACQLATIRHRLEGWLSELRGAGARVRVYGTQQVHVDDVLRRRIALALDDAPTAVLAYSDLAALEVLEQARTRGIAVPEELSIVGFDDNPIAARVTPALTTVRQDLQAKGALATQLLLGLIAGDDPATPPPLGTELVVRDSTAPASR